MNIQFSELGHVYTVDGIVRPSVTQIISDLRLSPPYPDDNGQKEFGTYVHKAADLAAWGRLDTDATDPIIMAYISGFMEKVKEMNIRPIATEMRVYHDLGGYAGTLDNLCRVYGGDLAIIDYKTGTPPPCVELQLCGYITALQRMLATHPGLDTHLGIVGDKAVASVPIRRFSMQLLPNRAIVREYVDPFDFTAWASAVNVWKWRNDRPKG